LPAGEPAARTFLWPRVAVGGVALVRLGRRWKVVTPGFFRRSCRNAQYQASRGRPRTDTVRGGGPPRMSEGCAGEGTQRAGGLALPFVPRRRPWRPSHSQPDALRNNPTHIRPRARSPRLVGPLALTAALLPKCLHFLHVHPFSRVREWLCALSRPAGGWFLAGRGGGGRGTKRRRPTPPSSRRIPREGWSPWRTRGEY